MEPITRLESYLSAIAGLGNVAPPVPITRTEWFLAKILERGGGSLPIGGTAGQVLTKRSSTDGDAEWRDSQGGDLSIIEGDFADVETDPFTNAHAIGDWFVIDGQLYKAKTAIAAGDALDVETNAETTTVMKEVKASVTYSELTETITVPSSFGSYADETIIFV